MIFAGDALHAAHDLHGPLAVQLVEGEIQDGRDLLLPANAAIAMLADRGLHPAACLGRDIRAAVYDFRHSWHRHAGLLAMKAIVVPFRTVPRLGVTAELMAIECSENPSVSKVSSDDAGSGTGNVDSAADRPLASLPKRSETVSQLSAEEACRSARIG